MERYPISVRLVGVMHKEKSKMYMTSVLWSDQSDIIVYRSFQEFKKMHKQLKKEFPSASKLKKSDRVLPKFQDKKMKQSSTQKGPTKSMVHLKLLQKYCDELLSSDPRVSQSAELLKFFQPKDKELQPDFTKNSIMIMQSDDDAVRGGGRHGTGGTVSQPFITETYRCVAQYETKDTKNKPFKVAVDEKVDVLIKDKAGWWLVEKEDKRMAWFPAPYLEKINDDEDDDDEVDETGGTCGRGMLYTAIKNYKATKDDEITVSIGSVVEVMQMSENGWWLIRYKEKVGYIPTMYLQPYHHPQIHMPSHQPDSRPSSPLLSPTSSLEQQSKLSRSQGNLLQLPPFRSSSPRPITPNSKRKSRSLNVLSQPPPAQPATSIDTPSSSPQPAPPPTIKVELDGDEEEEEYGGSREDAESSFMSDCSDFSFSDDFSSSSSGSSINLSYSANDDRLRLSRTPPPMVSNRLSPTGGPEGKLIPSISDPNLYKGPSSPKVPPRPRAQEILTRCTTVTRKNAARGGQTPTQTEIFSR
ncbi:NADPH oxidase organizer 1-like [Parambassis ranga]|uniref:NADPH oxidase organizer 1-like n=1 Tax=Parambassis ranga TaxID=210632 RepID=A0A6P7IQK0_9TELE|nr:NADPH oxidase organizer 1 [Parambassis ranga]